VLKVELGVVIAMVLIAAVLRHRPQYALAALEDERLKIVLLVVVLE
jgi:hypothetical protein